MTDRIISSYRDYIGKPIEELVKNSFVGVKVNQVEIDTESHSSINQIVVITHNGIVQNVFPGQPKVIK